MSDPKLLSNVSPQINASNKQDVHSDLQAENQTVTASSNPATYLVENPQKKGLTVAVPPEKTFTQGNLTLSIDDTKEIIDTVKQIDAKITSSENNAGPETMKLTSPSNPQNKAPTNLDQLIEDFRSSVKTALSIDLNDETNSSALVNRVKENSMKYNALQENLARSFWECHSIADSCLDYDSYNTINEILQKRLNPDYLILSKPSEEGGKLKIDRQFLNHVYLYILLKKIIANALNDITPIFSDFIKQLSIKENTFFDIGLSGFSYKIVDYINNHSTISKQLTLDFRDKSESERFIPTEVPIIESDSSIRMYIDIKRFTRLSYGALSICQATMLCMKNVKKLEIVLSAETSCSGDEVETTCQLIKKLLWSIKTMVRLHIEFIKSYNLNGLSHQIYSTIHHSLLGHLEVVHYTADNSTNEDLNLLLSETEVNVMLKIETWPESRYNLQLFNVPILTVITSTSDLEDGVSVYYTSGEEIAPDIKEITSSRYYYVYKNISSIMMSISEDDKVNDTHNSIHVTNFINDVAIRSGSIDYNIGYQNTKRNYQNTLNRLFLIINSLAITSTGLLGSKILNTPSTIKIDDQSNSDERLALFLIGKQFHMLNCVCIDFFNKYIDFVMVNILKLYNGFQSSLAFYESDGDVLNITISTTEDASQQTQNAVIPKELLNSSYSTIVLDTEVNNLTFTPLVSTMAILRRSKEVAKILQLVINDVDITVDTETQKDELYFKDCCELLSSIVISFPNLSRLVVQVNNYIGYHNGLIQQILHKLDFVFKELELVIIFTIPCPGVVSVIKDLLNTTNYTLAVQGDFQQILSKECLEDVRPGVSKEIDYKNNILQIIADAKSRVFYIKDTSQHSLETTYENIEFYQKKDNNYEIINPEIKNNILTYRFSS